MVFSDTCLNGSVEVYTELRGFTQAVVASSFLVDGRGWDYRNWMQRTDREMPTSAQEWAQGAVSAYEETYPQRSGSDVRQLAAFSTSGGDLVKAFGKVVKALLTLKPKPAKLLLKTAIAQTEKIEEVSNLDLRQLVCHLLDLAKDHAAVSEACSAFLLVFDEAQIGISEQPYGDYPLGGLTIWCPIGDKDQAGVGAYYPKLEFAKKTKWLKCLKQVFPEVWA